MIYLDNASTTQVKEEVCMAMVPYLSTNYFNPSSPYSAAYEVKEAVNKARKTIADTLQCSPEEIYFTSSGSEADNWAIKCMALNSNLRRPHIITSQIEHHAVLNTCQWLKRLGLAEVTYLPVNSNGVVDPRDVEKNIKDNTVLVSIMTINNEIGTVQPIYEIAEVCRYKDIPFHTDAVQAYGKIEIIPKPNLINMMSVSGHKIGAPKGIGFLYMEKEISDHMCSLISGGQQEFGFRAGTENVPYIIGLAKACELTYAHMDSDVDKVNMWCDELTTRLEKFSKIKFNNIAESNIINLNVYDYGIRAEQLVAFMDELGICIGSGSACNSQSNEPSHVLKAIGLSSEEADCCVRISPNAKNTDKDIDLFIQAMDLAITTMANK